MSLKMPSTKSIVRSLETLSASFRDSGKNGFMAFDTVVLEVTSKKPPAVVNGPKFPAATILLFVLLFSAVPSVAELEFVELSW